MIRQVYMQTFTLKENVIFLRNLAKGVSKVSNPSLKKYYKEENIMAKLCPRGKAAAKRKFKVYPSRMLTHTLLQFVQVKLNQVVKRKDKGRKPHVMVDLWLMKT